MRPVVRPLLINLGIGREYFQRSEHPAVRARATISYLNQFHKQAIPLGLFANRAMRDCIIQPEYKIHPEATHIYKDFILEFFDEPQVKGLREHLERHAYDSCEYPLRAMSIYSLINELGLNDPFPVV